METLSEFETYEQPIPRIVIPILGNADADSGAHRPRRRRLTHAKVARVLHI